MRLLETHLVGGSLSEAGWHQVPVWVGALLDTLSIVIREMMITGAIAGFTVVCPPVLESCKLNLLQELGRERSNELIPAYMY